MKKHDIKIMFRFIKAVFIGFLTSIINTSNHTKYVSLINQFKSIQPALISLPSNNTVKDYVTIHMQLT